MSLFNKREKQAFEVMNERNKQYLDSVSQDMDKREDEVYPEGTFEKGDLPAIIISALLVFFPIILIMLIIVVLVFRFMLIG
ncbi:MAG: hypothetical protein IJH64_14895 [Oscillospiraceae bacterium]|nr:hypothetical protein [Oscillospiraceae bacterium]MBR0452154.1 hypothetical protein [Oscillospiraceae bacterium]